MSKTLKKRMFLVAKITLAVLLLGWVISKAHWSDYVLARDGSTWIVLDRVDGGKQYVAESWTAMLLAGRTSREIRLFLPEAYVPVDPDGSAGTMIDGYIRRGIGQTLRDIKLLPFLLAVAGFPLSLLVVAWRFWFLLRRQGVKLPLWESVRLTYLGQFFNMVIPGTVGGDVVKAWYATRHTPKKVAVIVTIFIDRILGMAELVLMSSVILSIVLAAGVGDWGKLKLPTVAVSVLGGATLLMGVVLMWSGLRERLGLTKLSKKLPMAEHLQAAGKALRLFRRQPMTLVVGLAMTVLAHLFFIGAISMLGVAMELNVPYYSYFVYLPLIYIIGAVPITPGGVGLVENLYVEFFQGPGVNASTIVAMAMFARILPMLWGLPGLWVAIHGPKLPPSEQMQQELAEAEKQLTE